MKKESMHNAVIKDFNLFMYDHTSCKKAFLSLLFTSFQSSRKIEMSY